MFRRSSAGATEGKAQDTRGVPGGRSSEPAEQGTKTPEAPAKKPPAETGKGRPTPKRSAAEAGRYRSITGSTTSGRGRPPAAGGKRKLTPEEKTRERAEWRRKQDAMRRGEEWALGPRDRGPVKRLARDYVDAHRRPSEFYMYALIVLVIALFAGKSSSALGSYMQVLLLVIVVVIVIDALMIRRALRKLAAERFPNESTRGLTFYAVMRALQLRRFRTPGPRVKPGDKF